MDAELRLAWSEWLTQEDWDWFLTITFREPVPMCRQESVVHAAGMTIRACLWEPRFDHSRLFLAAEPHQSYALHLHGLYKRNAKPWNMSVETYSWHGKFHKRQLWEKLHETFGRSRVSTPRGVDAVSKYVSKYCVKAGGYYQMW